MTSPFLLPDTMFGPMPPMPMPGIPRMIVSPDFAQDDVTLKEFQ